MYCMIRAMPITSPATKPPPGWLWPRSRMNTPTASASGSRTRVATTSIRGWRSPASAPVLEAAQALAGGAAQRAVEQREDRQRRDAQDDDLAERVVAAEVDQDHVDDVGPAAAGLGLLEVVGGDGLREVAGEHGIEGHRDGDAACGGDAQIAPVPQARRLARCLLRQVVERQQHQDRGHDLDRQLRQGEVGRGEEHEGQGHHQAHDAGQNQGQQTVPVPADHRSARGQHQEPEHQRRHVDGQRSPLPGAVVAAEEGREADADHDQDGEQQATLQRAVVERVGEAARRRRRPLRSRRRRSPWPRAGGAVRRASPTGR